MRRCWVGWFGSALLLGPKERSAYGIIADGKGALAIKGLDIRADGHGERAVVHSGQGNDDEQEGQQIGGWSNHCKSRSSRIGIAVA